MLKRLMGKKVCFECNYFYDYGFVELDFLLLLNLCSYEYCIFFWGVAYDFSLLNNSNDKRCILNLRYAPTS